MSLKESQASLYERIYLAKWEEPFLPYIKIMVLLLEKL